MKRVVKGFFLFLATSGYASLLFLTATAVPMFFTLRDSSTIKGWLKDSNIYAAIVDEQAKLVKVDQEGGSGLSVEQDDIRSIAGQVFTAESLQSDSEQVIDGLYKWFQGRTTGPEFSIDLSGRQATFAAAVRTQLEQKIAELPECKTTAGKFSSQAVDPLKEGCRPSGTQITKNLDNLEETLAEKALPQTKFSGDDLKITKDGQEQRLATVYAWLPKVYRALTYVPWILAGLTLLAVLTLIFFSTSRRKGVRRVAHGLLFTGVILILSGIFLKPVLDKVNNWSTKSVGEVGSYTEKVINPLISEVFETYGRYSIIFGGIYVVPAIVMYGGLMLTRHKQEDVADVETAEEQYVEEIADTPIEGGAEVSAPIPQQSIPQLAPQTNVSPQPSMQTNVPSVQMSVEPPAPPQRPQAALTARRPTREVVRRPTRIQG